MKTLLKLLSVAVVWSLCLSTAHTQGSATLSWVAPSSFTDGSSLDPVADLVGYGIYQNTQQVNVAPPNVTVFVVVDVGANRPGDPYELHEFWVTAIANNGSESLMSNIVVNIGMDALLGVTLSGASQDTTWFVGLADGTPIVAAGDIEGTHAGWVEVTAYSEGTRQAWVDGGVSGQSVSNTASKATFSINGTTTVGGEFLSGDNTKGDASPAVAILYAAGAFTGEDRSLVNLDSIDVTATFTIS